MDKVQTLGLDNNDAEATKILIGGLRAVQAKWQAGLVALIASEKRQNEEATAVADTTYLFARNLMLALSAAAVLFGVTLAVVITRSITRRSTARWSSPKPSRRAT